MSQRSTPGRCSHLQIRGTIKLDKRTKNLAKRLKPGDIALVDHEDIDSTAACMLVEAGVRAVVNAAKSCSGRYPNLGPQVLLEAGIPILDNAGIDTFKGLRDGDQVEIVDGDIRRNGSIIAHAEPLTLSRANELLEKSKANLDMELEHFVENTLTYVTKEKSLLFDPTNLPDVATLINGRHVLVVVRGESHKEDLAIVRTYIREDTSGTDRRRWRR